MVDTMLMIGVDVANAAMHAEQAFAIRIVVGYGMAVGGIVFIVQGYRKITI